MKLTNAIKSWLNQEHTSGARKFLQITVLIIGGLCAMLLGVLLVALILIASPVLTILILLFLAIYGITALIRS